MSAEAWLAEQLPAMTTLLARMVDTDSGSHDKPGNDALGAVITDFLAGHGITTETLPQAVHGDCLRAGVPGAGRPVLLLGHRDTVFPQGEAARRPFTVRDGLAYGPGVADMKGGLVMNLFVLAALARFGTAVPVTVLITADEEIGSPEGRPVIEAEARRVRAVLNAEPGRPSGNVVTGRKGGVFMEMRIEGRAAHSGSNFEHGISAIEELSRKVQAIHALTDPGRGITLNVGLVRGGQSVNTVAPWAEGEIDLRTVHPADRDRLVAAVTAIVGSAAVPGTRATLRIKGEFLPLVQDAASARLFEAYVAASSGPKPAGEFVGGCADSGFTAALGAPTLCATGPVGGRVHTPDEYLHLDSLVPRAQACVRTIAGLDRAGLQ